MKYKKMLQDICDLVETDFCEDMEIKTINSEFTQSEAKEMAKLLAKVYSVAHCIHCKACNIKYK